MACSETRVESVRMYVIRPTAPSPGSSMPSYNCCAIIIVFLTGNRAACWSLLVMNGGTALFFRSFVVTDADNPVAPALRSASTASASAWLVTLMFEPSRFCSFASNSGGTAAGQARRDVPVLFGNERSISRSRSHTSFNATDCTRPALRPRRTLSQSSGLIL